MNSRTIKHQQFTIELGQEQVTVNVAASARKSLRLQLNKQGEIDLRIPLSAPKAQILTFLNGHHAWLLRQRHAFQQRQLQPPVPLYFRGRALAFKAAAVSTLQLAEHTLLHPQTWTDTEVSRALDLWLRAQAYCEYEKVIERWWPLFQHLGPRPVLRIKKMRSRWGSLSQRGYINLNLALMQLPAELLELVVVHELCHLKHFDHGAGFKALMGQCLPDWLSREQQLKRWQPLVM